MQIEITKEWKPQTVEDVLSDIKRFFTCTELDGKYIDTAGKQFDDIGEAVERQRGNKTCKSKN